MQDKKYTPSIRVQKFWQGKESFLVWQVNLIQNADNSSKIKAYLIVDSRSTSPGVRLQAHKPDNLNPAGVIVSLMRKKTKTASIMSIKKHSKLKDLLLTLGTNGKPIFSIYLEFSRPPIIHLVNDKQTVSIARISSKGHYTKPKDLDIFLNDQWYENTSNVQNEWIKEFLNSNQPTQAAQKIVTGPTNGAQKELILSLKRRLKTIRRSYLKTNEDLPKEEEINQFKKQADLLQTYAYLIDETKDNLVLPQEITGATQDEIIPLDPDKKVGQLIAEQFKQLKRLSKKRAMSLERLSNIKETQAKIESTLHKLQTSEISKEEEEALRKNLGLKRKPLDSRKTSPNQNSHYNTYIIDEKKILVGKSSGESDTLVKESKANDYWLHVIGSTGSHIIIPANQGLKASLPEKLKRSAAVLALHFSKIREDQKGEVYFARKSDIRKRKGMPPGLWLVDRSETYFVNYNSEELASILNSKS